LFQAGGDGLLVQLVMGEVSRHVVAFVHRI
jgi:hypothetical protein